MSSFLHSSHIYHELRHPDGSGLISFRLDHEENSTRIIILAGPWVNAQSALPLIISSLTSTSLTRIATGILLKLGVDDGHLYLLNDVATIIEDKNEYSSAKMIRCVLS